MDSGAASEPNVKSKSKHKCWSLKTDRSRLEPLTFKKKRSRKKFRPHSGLSCLSGESGRSRDPPLFFNEETESESESEIPRSPQTRLDLIFQCLWKEIKTFLMEQLKYFYKVLASDNPEECLQSADDETQSNSEAVLKITLDFLGKMKQERLAELLLKKTTVAAYGSKMKRNLQNKFSSMCEGIVKTESPVSLNQIFTELCITKGGPTVLNQEHEVRHIETLSKKPVSSKTTISCTDLFKSHTPSEKNIRTVMTIGVAGIGKTMLTQKFSLDWAEGRANREFQMLFPFTFRELNAFQHTCFSLVGLLHHFFGEAPSFCSFEPFPVLFIFDGLDECRLSLDFIHAPALTEATKSAPVEVLLVNLIRGSLLPLAKLWITTRPAAAKQIPAEFVSMVTEILGFTDPQKEQYFRLRFKDNEKATILIAHIKASQSLHIMCFMPVFCWILSTVLLHEMETGATHQLPHTLTQMYIQFLVVQAKVKNVKFDNGSETDDPWTPETRRMVESLAKLAFEELQKGNLIFYEPDLIECGLDVAAAAKYSGVFTQVFRNEQGLYQTKVHCFIHATVQEFLAAFHVHQIYFNTGVNLLYTQQTSERPKSPESKASFYRSVVDQALASPNGHLDLFSRFLLGLSLPTNQELLHGLLTPTGTSTDAVEETAEYLKEKLNKGLTSEKSLNLFHCLNELNDRTLMEVIQEYMRGGFYSLLSCPGHWAAVAFILLSSSSDFTDFDLKNYHASETALQGLLPVIKAATKAFLSGCNLSPNSCDPLASVISSSSLTLLDLSNNDLKDSGIELLCYRLKSSPCQLETLKLSGCLVSERGGASLASALNSSLSNLEELDVSYNHLGSSAEMLTALRDNPHSSLNTLKLKPAGEQWMIPGPRKYRCKLSLDPNTAHQRLHLSEDKRTVTHLEEDQQYPDHRERFTDCPQVLSATGLTGRCYWEVEWKVEGGDRWVVDIALSHKGGRGDSSFGDDDQSWSLRISSGWYYANHNGTVYFSSDEVQGSSEKLGLFSSKERMALDGMDEARVSSDEVDVPLNEAGLSPHKMAVGRVGVFLDSEAGSLSFYRASPGGELTHLHTFTSSFTEPLFPGFGLSNPGSSVTLEEQDV